jgi:hypothetical protein
LEKLVDSLGSRDTLQLIKNLQNNLSFGKKLELWREMGLEYAADVIGLGHIKPGGEKVAAIQIFSNHENRLHKAVAVQSFRRCQIIEVISTEPTGDANMKLGNGITSAGPAGRECNKPRRHLVGEVNPTNGTLLTWEIGTRRKKGANGI